jgi:hypothetical protein
MSWVISGSQNRDIAGISNVSLLLRGNGNLNDSSPEARTILTFNGAASATPPSYPSNNSAFEDALYFDSTAPIDYLTVSSATVNNGDWTFLHNNSINYTIEAWIRRNSVATAGAIVCTAASSLERGVYFATSQTSAGDASFFICSGSGFFSGATSGGLISANTWHHVALMFTAGATANAKIFIDGTQRLSTSTSVFAFSPSTPSNPLNIGRFVRTDGEQGSSLNGYIDELRITKSARYQSNFTPPTAPFPDI